MQKNKERAELATNATVAQNVATLTAIPSAATNSTVEPPQPGDGEAVHMPTQTTQPHSTQEPAPTLLKPNTSYVFARFFNSVKEMITKFCGFILELLRITPNSSKPSTQTPSTTVTIPLSHVTNTKEEGQTK